MKTLKFHLFIIAILINVSLYSQIQVTTAGNVGVWVPTSATISNQFQVGNPSSYNSSTVSVGSNFEINSYNSSNPYAFVQARDNTNNAIGLIFRTQNIYPWLSQGTIVYLSTIVNAMAIAPNGNVGIGTTTPAVALDVYGSIHMNGSAISSDKRLKTNIININNSLANLLKLSGVRYNLIPNGIGKLLNLKDTTNSQQTPTDTALYNHSHIGFLAQDVQKIYPELVYADKNGILSLDYIGLIPVLVESIKELSIKSISDSIVVSKLSKQIKSDSITIVQMNANLTYLSNQLQSLTSQVNLCCGKGSKVTNASAESDQPFENGLMNYHSNAQVNNVSALFQNSPNPFNLSTTIGYTLASNIGTATIYVYNMQGTQLKSYPIYATGNGSITINGSDLSAGMYLYALIVDGKIIDTKKMILTN